ncbi:MAG: PEGA domain-containing protein [Candidatus Riflebacteria bacterium]|nr:PEGA domain-containing protein [Candidatus Riflebacteria bacterium]
MKKIFILVFSILTIGWAFRIEAKDATSACLTLGNAVEYVIITPLRYASIFQQLADWKTAKGVPTRVISLEWVLKNYQGKDVPVQIREFIKDAKKTWNVKWVLLGGDTEDKEGALIPVRYARSGIRGGTDIPSDLYYANLDGTWDGNNNGIYGEPKDNCDLIPEVFIGRASVDSREDASTFVQKVLNYEKSPPKNWVKRALLVGMDHDEQTPGEHDAEQLAGAFFKDYQIQRFYDSQGANPDQIKNGFSTFNPHFVYVGAHGNVNLFAANGLFKSEDADALSNSFPFIYTSISCLTNYFDKDSLSEHFMNNPKGGAVAYWACSREGWYQVQNEGHYYTILMIKDFYDLLLNDPKNISNHIGEAVARARAKYVPEAMATDGQYRWLVFGMNLLGDPEMPVWTDEPQELLVTTKPDPQNSRLTLNISANGAPVIGALACLRFKEENKLQLTISAKNLVPKEVEIPFDAAPGLYVSDVSDNKGFIQLPIKGSKSVVQDKIAELVFLDQALRDLEVYLPKTSRDGPVFEKLTRDYNFLQTSMERRQKEIRKFFVSLVDSGKFGDIEEGLSVLEGQLKENPSAIAQFQFVLKAVSDKMRFNLAQLQDKDGIQARIFTKIISLQKNITGVQNTQTQTPSKALGCIKVTSNPSGATVLLDSIPKGETPCVIEKVSFGKHVLEVQAQGYSSAKETLTITDQKTVQENVDLKNECCIQGQIKVAYNGDLSGTFVRGYKRVTVNGKSSMEKFIEAAPDASGCYCLNDLPKEDFTIQITKAGYSPEFKYYYFSMRDQEYRQRYDVTLYPLCAVSGKNPDIVGAKVILFEKDGREYYSFGDCSAAQDGSFSFKSVRLGTYKVVVSKPGYCLGFVDLVNTDGKDKTVDILLQPVKGVRLCIMIGNVWNKYDMTPDQTGKYSLNLPLKGQKDPYCYCFFLMGDQQQAGRPFVIDPASQVSTSGEFSNIVSVEKDKDVTFQLDSTKEPIYYQVEKDSSGKIVGYSLP